jgi:hypothetical protein
MITSVRRDPLEQLVMHSFGDVMPSGHWQIPVNLDVEVCVKLVPDPADIS